MPTTAPVAARPLHGSRHLSIDALNHSTGLGEFRWKEGRGRGKERKRERKEEEKKKRKKEEEEEEKKEAAAQRRSAKRGKRKRRLAGEGGKGEERQEGGRKRRQESGGSGARSARNFRASRVYRYFNRHRGYILQKGGGGWGAGCTFVARRIGKVLSPGYGRRGVDSGGATRTTVARPRLETRTHCKAFLMTEEILSYTHPFRTPRLQRERFVSGDVYLRIGSRV